MITIYSRTDDGCMYYCGDYVEKYHLASWANSGHYCPIITINFIHVAMTYFISLQMCLYFGKLYFQFKSLNKGLDKFGKEVTRVADQAGAKMNEVVDANWKSGLLVSHSEPSLHQPHPAATTNNTT